MTARARAASIMAFSGMARSATRSCIVRLRVPLDAGVVDEARRHDDVVREAHGVKDVQVGPL